MADSLDAFAEGVAKEPGGSHEYGVHGCHLQANGTHRRERDDDATIPIARNVSFLTWRWWAVSGMPLSGVYCIRPCIGRACTRVSVALWTLW